MQCFGQTHAQRRARSSGAVESVLLAALVLLAGAGCSEGEGANEPAGSAVSGSGSLAPASGAPLYVLSTRVRNPDGDTSFLIAVDALSEPTSVDLSSALEIPGVARAYGPSGTGKVYVTSSEGGTMTEVSYAPDGTVTPGRIISFAALGVGGTTGGNVNAFLSASKAYHINQGTLDVIVWSPESMTITGSFPTGLEVSSGATNRIFQQEPIVVGDRLLVASFQVDVDTVSEGITTLTVFDTTTDQVVFSDEDARCSHFTSFARDAQGDLYFASNWLHAANYFLFGAERVPHPPCMLRIRAGETRFDPDWSRSLEPELGTPIWAGLFPRSGGSVLVQGIAEDLVTGALEADELRIARPWRWYAVRPQGAVLPIAADAALQSPLSVAGPVDDDYYLTSYLPDVGTSVLVQTTVDAGIRPGLEAPGQIATVTRVY